MRRVNAICAGVFGIICAVLPVGSDTSFEARAGLFSRLAREAGDVGGTGVVRGLDHLGPVGRAAAHVRDLPDGKGALAAHATPEGHWQFVNRDGEVFTAGSVDEMQRVLPTLAPDAVSGESKLTLYLSEDSALEHSGALKSLPQDAQLVLVTDDGVMAMARGPNGFTAQVKPNLSVGLGDARLFRETVHVLRRRLNKSEIRTIALDASGGKRLPSGPRLEAGSKLPIVDVVQPEGLLASLGAIRGQSALVTGRVADGRLIAATPSGGEVAIDLAALRSAAREADVNLIVLANDTGRQAVGLNWLWQPVEVAGLKDAGGAATMGDFLDGLAARRGRFSIEASDEGLGRVRISAMPDAGGGGIVNEGSTWVQDGIEHLIGEVVTKSVEISARDQAAQTELDGRFIPGIPTAIQLPYLMGVVAGLLAWSTSRAWFARLWPSRAPDGAGRLWRTLRRVPRALVYLLVFLPVAGLPALAWQTMVNFWNSVTAKVAWFKRRFLARQA